jgi:hypothetical protein
MLIGFATNFRNWYKKILGLWNSNKSQLKIYLSILDLMGAISSCGALAEQEI